MTAAMPRRALLCCLSLAAAQQRSELKAKAWFGKSNNRKQSVPLEQHDGADASEPYLVHDVPQRNKTAITHRKLPRPLPLPDRHALPVLLRRVSRVAVTSRRQRRDAESHETKEHEIWSPRRIT